MTRTLLSTLRSAALLTLLSVGGNVVADDEPGALASPTDKLNYMLSTWKGKTLEQLQDVWGGEEMVERRGGNRVYVFERRVKLRAGVLGVTVFGEQGGLRCVAKFEVDAEDKIVRVTRQGGGQDCWNALRKYDPD